jgi:hypothetical protein
MNPVINASAIACARAFAELLFIGEHNIILE